MILLQWDHMLIVGSSLRPNLSMCDLCFHTYDMLSQQYVTELAAKTQGENNQQLLLIANHYFSKMQNILLFPKNHELDCSGM